MELEFHFSLTRIFLKGYANVATMSNQPAILKLKIHS